MFRTAKPKDVATSPVTLAAAIQATDDNRWKWQRSRDRNVKQAMLGVATLERIITGQSRSDFRPRVVTAAIVKERVVNISGWPFRITHYAEPPMFVPDFPGETITAAQVEQHHVRTAVQEWQAQGLSAATIVIRLTCLSVLGVTVVRGCYPRIPRKLKFWLRPEQEAAAYEWLARQRHPRFAQLAALIRFVTAAGTRIEEALRLAWSDVILRPGLEKDGRATSLTVLHISGTKTKLSQRTLPISAAAVAALEGQRGIHPTLVFPLPYHDMNRAWVKCREHIGLDDPSAATLKALRRTSARNLTVNGLPTAMLQNYLGHSKIETTLGYLRLTGGYSTDEYAKYL